MVQNYFATHLAQVWQALRDETQTALLAGLAGGMAILVILTLFPGDPFDYGAGDGREPKDSKNTAPPTKEHGNGARSRRGADTLRAEEAGSEEEGSTHLVIDEKRLAEKARQAEKLFGIKAERRKQAVVERRRGERRRPC